MEPISPDAIEPPSNVLLVHSSRCDPEQCSDLRRVADDRAELRVTFSNEVPDPAAGTDAPAKLGLVSVGDVIRAASADAGPDFAAPLAVDAVADPTDLSEIGVSVSRFCKHWADDDGDERIVVCFRSLDALLRHAPPKKVFQFTHMLTNRLSSVDAVSHFHLDPTAHDDKIVSTFGSIFDEVVADDSARDRLPEATDDDVAAVLAEWDDDPTDEEDDDDDVGYQPRSEATDEEIARLVGE